MVKDIFADSFYLYNSPKVTFICGMFRTSLPSNSLEFHNFYNETLLQCLSLNEPEILNIQKD